MGMPAKPSGLLLHGFSPLNPERVRLGHRLAVRLGGKRGGWGCQGCEADIRAVIAWAVRSGHCMGGESGWQGRGLCAEAVRMRYGG